MDASVGFLLENLKQLVVNHAKLISGAKDELQSLQQELGLMKKKLEDASKKRKKEEAFKEWEKQIRKVVYKVEDTIDTYLTQMATKNAISKMVGPGGASLAKDVKNLRETSVRNVFNEAITYFVNLNITDPSDGSDEQEIEQWRSTEPKKSHIVGLEDETLTLIGYLKEESNQLGVISIKGMPGLGKTTFAWKVFQDPDIQYDFPVRIWVTVSQTLNRKAVFLTILKYFTQDDKFSRMSDEDLTIVVEEKLAKGKFLIVFDDVWTLNTWNQIKAALPVNNGMGKVLITTRDNEVASRVTNMERSHIHQLRFLTNDECWELLQYEIYGALKAVDEELVNVGKLIANNCDGLPLSVVVIAGILSGKMTNSSGSTSLVREEWEKVSASVQDYLINEDKEGRMSKIIELSYAKLPYELRECFLYLGMFPEDALIPASKLTLLWIAEGFIQPKTGKRLEDISLDSLNDLISRNLVIMDKTKLDGKVKTCRVHDAIREFCKSEASVERQNLFQEIRMSERKVFEPDLSNLKEYRRICIHSYVHNLFSQKVPIPARSFLCFPKEPIILKPTDIAYVNKAFSLLRVFDAEKIKFPKFPAKMTELFHLRYLTLSLAFDWKVLPEPIFNLWNLQTLIVETTSRTLEIKADLWKLMHLRHFKTKSSINLGCKSLKGPGGEHLQTLGRLSPESCMDSAFVKAKNLHTLGIHGDLSKLLESKCLAKLDSLSKLKLEHDVYPEVAAENPLRGLPQHHNFPTNLMVLTLKGTYLNWPEMATIANLSNLKVLKLKDNAFIGSYWEVNYGFDKLEFLYIERTDLVFWKASDHAFTRLRSLTLKNCEKLEKVPSELGKKLEFLYLERVTRAAIICAEKIERVKENDSKVKKGVFKLVIGSGDKNPNS